MKQPKDLENHWESALEGLQVSLWCKMQESLLESEQGSWLVENLEILQCDATAAITWILACFEVGELVGLWDN